MGGTKAPDDLENLVRKFKNIFGSKVTWFFYNAQNVEDKIIKHINWKFALFQDTMRQHKSFGSYEIIDRLAIW